LADRHRFTIFGPSLCRVATFRNIGQFLLCHLASFISGQDAQLTDSNATADPTRVSVLDRKRPDTAGLYPKQEAVNFIVPNVDIAPGIGHNGVDGPLGQFHRRSLG
jgi:hypothetical protein